MRESLLYGYKYELQKIKYHRIVLAGEGMPIGEEVVGRRLSWVVGVGRGYFLPAYFSPVRSYR